MTYSAASQQMVIVKRNHHWSGGGVRRLDLFDCNKCKHRLTCLLDPKSNQTFEVILARDRSSYE